jgi:hypothetical protein
MIFKEPKSPLGKAFQMAVLAVSYAASKPVKSLGIAFSIAGLLGGTFYAGMEYGKRHADPPAPETESVPSLRP